MDHALPSFEIRNRLLRALSGQDRALLLPLCEAVELRAGEVLVEAGGPVEHLWFVESGVGSLMAVGPDGERVEVASVGPEGLAGACAVLGADRSPFRVLVQAPGAALRIRAADLARVMEASPGLRGLLSRYLQVVTVQIAHTALANGRFSIAERLARWILMRHDRAERDSLRFTHDLLALMLGVRRPGVTTAIHMLEGRGLIKATRGQVAILDRAGLEAAAGGSYGGPEAEYERLIGGNAPTASCEPEPKRRRAQAALAVDRA